MQRDPVAQCAHPPLRIALVVPGLAVGGGVPAVARFVRDTALRSGRYEVKLISLAMDSSDRSHLALRSPATWRRGVQSVDATWRGSPYIHVGAFFGELEFQNYRPRGALTQLLADCDLVQVVCGSPAWANSVCGLSKPVSLQVATRARVERRQRDARPRGAKDWWRKAMTEVTDLCDDRALRRVDAIQVENPWMLDYARSINADRSGVDIRYAPPGVDAGVFAPLSRREVQSDPYVLCVARLDDVRKNIGLLLEAYALLPASARRLYRLVLAGASGPPPQFWERADALGVRERVSYIAAPSLEELVALYQRAAAFVLPSDEEGLGVVILEAMACGVPVVSTRSGGPDGIITDGEDGYLVPRDDAPSMTARIQQLLQDESLNVEMGRRARQTIETRYDEQVAGKAFLDVWDRMLGKQSPMHHA